MFRRLFPCSFKNQSFFWNLFCWNQRLYLLTWSLSFKQTIHLQGNTSLMNNTTILTNHTRVWYFTAKPKIAWSSQLDFLLYIHLKLVCNIFENVLSKIENCIIQKFDIKSSFETKS